MVIRQQVEAIDAERKVIKDELRGVETQDEGVLGDAAKQVDSEVVRKRKGRLAELQAEEKKLLEEQDAITAEHGVGDLRKKAKDIMRALKETADANIRKYGLGGAALNSDVADLLVKGDLKVAKEHGALSQFLANLKETTGDQSTKRTLERHSF